MNRAQIVRDLPDRNAINRVFFFRKLQIEKIGRLRAGLIDVVRKLCPTRRNSNIFHNGIVNTYIPIVISRTRTHILYRVILILYRFT